MKLIEEKQDPTPDPLDALRSVLRHDAIRSIGILGNITPQESVGQHLLAIINGAFTKAPASYIASLQKPSKPCPTHGCGCHVLHDAINKLILDTINNANKTNN